MTVDVDRAERLAAELDDVSDQLRSMGLFTEARDARRIADKLDSFACSTTEGPS